jgi:hypothetical protein
MAEPTKIVESGGSRSILDGTPEHGLLTRTTGSETPLSRTRDSKAHFLRGAMLTTFSWRTVSDQVRTRNPDRESQLMSVEPGLIR